MRQLRRQRHSICLFLTLALLLVGFGITTSQARSLSPYSPHREAGQKSSFLLSDTVLHQDLGYTQDIFRAKQGSSVSQQLMRSKQGKSAPLTTLFFLFSILLAATGFRVGHRGFHLFDSETQGQRTIIRYIHEQDGSKD